MIVTNVIENHRELSFQFEQNYPNPFNLPANIKFSIPDLGFTTLIIYYIPGNEIAVLVNDLLPEGSYNFPFSKGKLSSGVYLYQLRS
jgi:hypothetical protein